MSVVISMLIGSKLSKWSLIKDSIETIIKNIGTSDYLLVIGIASHVSKLFIYKIRKITNLDKRIIIIKKHCDTFAIFTNHVIQNYSTNSKWFIVAHDDIELKTKNFMPKVRKLLKPLKDNIGWISFTDDDYLNGHWAPSTRPGYHLDFLKENAWNKRKMFQFHFLKDEWLNGNSLSTLKYDLPLAPVRCHAPFSHFIMIETKKLKQIGPCENWSVVSLLIDEDWGLSAMKEGMINIWVPNITYTHCRGKGTRASHIIREKGIEVAELFYKKWGFPHNPKMNDLKKIKQCSKKIIWSFNKRSFEWEYV